MHEFDANELKPFIEKLEKEQDIIDELIVPKISRLLVSKYNITSAKISKRAEDKMMRDMNYFKIEYDHNTIYGAFKVVVNPKRGVLPICLFLIERKTKRGRVFQLGFHGMKDTDTATFFTSHLFDRMIIRSDDVAENRYQAIKLVLGEFLMNILSFDGNNQCVLIDEHSAIFPNRYGCCLASVSEDNIVLIKTFIGANMLRPNQRSIHQAYMHSMKDTITAFDKKTFEALADQRLGELEKENQQNG